MANLSSENETTQNRAAVAVLSHMIRGMETVELARRVSNLEDNK